MLLSPEERKTALNLSRSLFKAKKLKETHTPQAVREIITDQLHAIPGIRLEYFEIVTGSDLLPAGSWIATDDIIGCLAARVGNVRLIDNINFSS
jgi:pantoate--beta-alanine ligase